MDGWKVSTPKLLKATDSPKCNNAGTDGYIRIPTNPSLVKPKVKMPLKLCEEEDAILEPIFSMTDIQFLQWDG